MWSSSSIQFWARLAALSAAWLLVSSPLDAAEVRIDIEKNPERKVKVAVPPFLDAGLKPAEGESLRQVLGQDLRLSGFFEVVTDLPQGFPADGREGLEQPERFERLAAAGIELLINVRGWHEGEKLLMEGYIFDPSSRQKLFGQRYSGPGAFQTRIVHVMAGEMIQYLTGVAPLTRSRLAYLRIEKGRKQVWVADYAGADPRPVSPAGELALFPEWLPDGRALVYTSFLTGFPELVYHDVDNAHQKILTSYPGMNANVSFSPDGLNFLATLSKDGNPEIYKLDLRGRVIQRLTHDQGVDTSPSYSPDGRQFAFVSDRSGGPQVYVMNSSGGRPTRLTYQGGYNVSPDWSPGGRLLAYCASVDRRYQLMLMNLATGEVEQLTAGAGNKEDPDWGVDDRHLVFTLTKDYQSDLYIIDIYTKELTQLTKGKGDFSSPTWSGLAP